jgi:anti-anti-sigma regulatory factor
MDSSALGMLLLLRNHAGGDDADVAIVNAKPDIIKLLETCKFNELFKVSALG